MVNDVESILKEIKDRVRAEGNASAPAAENSAAPQLAPARELTELNGNESLSRAAAHLTTTARAWDRLPPVFSNRSGAPARLELWIKARFKSWGRWFTWEQVNFNAAVHHALSELVSTLGSYQHELQALRQDLANGNEIRRQKHEEVARELEKLRATIEAHTTALRKDHQRFEQKIAANAERINANEERINAHDEKVSGINETLDQMNAAAEQLSVMLSNLAAETRASHSQLANNRIPELAAEIEMRLAEISSDLNEQQRVCFKQLSLEANEAAILEDRGRRALEARLEKLERGERS